MSHKTKAIFLRKASNSTDLTYTLNKAVKVLSAAGIPSLVVGGYAVQEHGYARFTADVDLVVQDVDRARAKLSISGFKENAGSSMTVTDRATKVEIDLLPGGGSVGPGPLALPIPEWVGEHPRIADLRTLIEMKLSSYLGSPVRRLRDKADVVELVIANNLGLDFRVDPAVAKEFEDIVTSLR